MEGVLWHVLASSRGGTTRVRIVRALDERPRNANQLAEELGMDYTTIRHHLDVLLENNIVKRPTDDYGAVYLLTDDLEAHRDTLETIMDTWRARTDDGRSKFGRTVDSTQGRRRSNGGTMTLWLDLARVAAAGNVALLLALAWVWVPAYREHGARHTLVLAIFAGFLLLENALWLVLYVLHDDFVGWFVDAGPDVQIGMLGLCGLEFVALAVMTYLTWQ